MKISKRNILICILLILMPTICFAANRFYRTRSDAIDRQYRAQLDKLFVSFMEMGEYTLKATNGIVYPGTGQRIFFDIVSMFPIKSGNIGKFKDKCSSYKSVLDETIDIYIYDVDVERSEGMKKYVSPAFPHIGHPWILGRNLIAGRRWSSYNRSGEFINKSKSAVSFRKEMEDYYDEMMLNNLEWFRDNKGRLHIPDFLLDKYSLRK